MIISQRIWNNAWLVYCDFERRKYNKLQSGYNNKSTRNVKLILIYIIIAIVAS